MKLPTYKIIFDRKKTASNTRTAPVVLQICHERKQIFRSLNIQIFQYQWKDGMVVNHPCASEFNMTISDVLTKMALYNLDLQKSGEAFSTSSFDAWWTRSRNSSESFRDYIENKIKSRSDIKDSTRRHHWALLSFMDDNHMFLTESDLTAENITFMDEKLTRSGLTTVTRYNYHKWLRSYINIGRREGFITCENPYSKLRLDRGKSKPREWLNDSELSALASCTLSGRHDRVRDLFLFQVYTGLSYADLMQLDVEKDLDMLAGKCIIRKRRQKTDNEFLTVLTPACLDILKKYGNKLPHLSNMKYNKYIAEAMSLAGIDKHITSHCARHTFAIMALNRGVPVEVLAKILGHADIKTTQIYAKIVDASVVDAFDKIF